MIAVRPPEYFPRLSYLALLHEVDTFVLADTFQYSRQSFQNRTKVRNPQGWQWISVPLKGRQHGLPIREVRIRQRVRWQPKHWRAFHYNYRSTPYFDYYEEDFRRIFDQDWTHLGDLTCATVQLLHRLFGFSSTVVRASAVEGAPANLPAVLEAFGDREVVLPAAVAAHDAPFVSRPRVLHYEDPLYRQNFDGFVPGMSAVGLLFNYGPQAKARLGEGRRLDVPEPGEELP